MNYKNVLKGYYDTDKKVKAIDLLTNQPYFIEDRPDMKQRIERAINFKQLLLYINVEPVMDLSTLMKSRIF
jgi:hypothetical protein